MSELALRLIAENKARHARGEDATYLDLGYCGLTLLPAELGDCVWVETLILSNKWSEYNIETKKWEEKESQNLSNPNRFASIAGVETLHRVKKLVVAKYHSDLHWPLKDLNPLSGLTQLQTLNCSSTQVSDLLPLSGLTQLRTLYCYRTQVNDLSPLSGLTQLQTLEFSWTSVSDLSPLSGLTQLQTLHCYRTQVRDLSPLSGLTQLQTLYCYRTQVRDLSPLSSLLQLQTLDCYRTQVSDLSPLSSLVQLQTLYCYRTQVSDLSPLSGLTQLQTLDCSWTSVSDLSSLVVLMQLQALDCSSTQVRDLSPLSSLIQLRMLNCSSTQVRDLLPLSGLTQLETLSCNSTQIRDLSPLSGLKQLQTLSCNSMQVRDLSPLSGLKQLQTLSCNSTQVRDLSLLSGLRQLQTLSCNSTQVSDLSPLSDLLHLQTLNCSSTQVRDLSPLSGLLQLQTLNCSSTQVSDLSPLSGLLQLQTLSCSLTQVRDLSPLSGLLQLQTLNCSSTQVSDLSPLSGLTQFRTLFCDSTPISDLSPLLPLIKEGREVVWGKWEDNKINVEDCPLVHPPPEIVKQGSEAIVQWFEDRKKQGTQQLNEAKVLILGEGGVGKTTLAEKIHYGFGRALPEESTHGIDILPHTFAGTSGQIFKANIWDFGGQEIYHATHQFFMTRRSLYILVDDARKEDTRFDYWLQIVELLSDNSPVVIVQNCKAGRRRDIDESGLRGRFGNIKEVVYLDLSQDQSEFEALVKRIQLELQTMPHSTESWPNNWVRTRVACEHLRQDTKRITYERFEEICAEHAMDYNTVVTLGQYLHDLGVVLYFHDDPLLRRTVFLDSQWMVNGVYEVLDDTGIKTRQGRFSRQDVAAIWEQSDYRRLHDELLQLMMKFELCYPIPDTTDQYIVPHLLPASTPALDWDEKNSLQLHYRYTFMPKGLLSRLIVRLHRFVKQTDLAWRTGVVFEREGARMRVVETYGEKYLRLHCLGPQSRELITIVSDEIDRLNNGYSGLKVEKQVPCNCPVCLRMEVPNFYDHADLIQRKERGKRTIECRNSYDDVDVLRLLDHVFVTTFFTPKKPKVFISYSKEDRVHLESLKKHLAVLRRQEALITWDDTQLIPGEEWDQGIKQQLATADLILLLVSADFMATDYIWQEIDIAIERHRNAEAVVVPIIVRPCDWLSAPFAKFAALPEKGKPVANWANPDEAWSIIVQKIRNIVNHIRNAK